MAFQDVVYRYRSQVGSKFAEAPSNKSEAFLVYSFRYEKERDSLLIQTLLLSWHSFDASIALVEGFKAEYFIRNGKPLFFFV